VLSNAIHFFKNLHFLPLHRMVFCSWISVYAFQPLFESVVWRKFSYRCNWGQTRRH